MQELTDFIMGASPSELQGATVVYRRPDNLDNFEFTECEFIVNKQYSGHAILRPKEWFPPIVPETQMTLWWNSFFPLERAPGAERRGFGTLAHVLTLLETIKTEYFNPKLLVVHAGDFDPRKNQLAKMGLNPPMPFDDYLRRSIEYANSIGFNFEFPSYTP